MSEKEFIIRKPDDWHLHLRDGEMLASVIKHSAANFERAIIMPNLVPPVVTTDEAIAYKERINQVIPPGMSFQPLMTLYLTEATKTSDIKQGVDLGVVTALKLYPAGATTNSENGVKEFGNVYSILEFMAEIDIPLLVHGRSRIRKLISLTEKQFSSKGFLTPSENEFLNCGSSWSTSPPKMPWIMSSKVVRISLQPSQPTI